VRVAVQKIDGVVGVDVSLEEGVAIIRFRSDGRATVAQVRRAIRDNGFTPKEAQVRIRGQVVEQAGKLVLAVPGRPRPYPLLGGTDDATSTERLGQALDVPVEVVGRVSERSEEDAPLVEVIRLTLRPAFDSLDP